MANIRSASGIQTPAGTLATSAGGGSTVLSSMWRTELQKHPPVDATNGPITADTGILSGDVSATTGLRFIPWDATDVQTGQPIFNYQGMVPSHAPAGIQSNAGRDCLLNANTPRWFNGATGQYRNGNQSIRVGIASYRVIPVWYTGQGQISASKIDNHIMVSDLGVNKHLSSAPTANDGLPNVITAGSGTYRREITNKRHEYKEYRFLLGPNCYFLGCWVDTISTLQRPKNRPQLFVHGVDSWQDPQTVIGTTLAWETGDYQCLPQPVVASFFSGMCHGVDAQGGTGEFDPNGTSGGDLDTYVGNRSSAAWSDSRVNWRRDWWSIYYPIWMDIGGWNDGTECPSPYQASYKARVAARIDKTISRIAAVGRDTRFVNVGIQSVEITSTSDAKYLMAQGQAEIPAMYPGVVLGHVPLMQSWWYDNSGTGATSPRNLYTNDSDRIHLTAVGDNVITSYYMEKVGQMSVDQAFLINTAKANVPIVSVPTS